MKDKNLRAHHIQAPISSTKDLLQKATASTLEKLNFEKFPWKHTAMKSSATSGWQAPLLSWIISFGAGGAVFYFLPNLPKLASAMGTITHSEWLRLINALLLTSAKIAGVLFIATLWTVPVGVWIGKNPRISKIAQPIVQNIAAFPAPVLFPLIALGMHRVGMSPGIISMCLMTIGNQWYMFFNVISGASRIPDELQLVARLYRFSTRDRWRKLYLPAIFPSLVTGWITAAGGSWNASIVAELVTFPGGEVRSPGIGLALAEAAAQGHTERLIAAVAVVTIALVVLNRSLWRSLHIYAEKVKAT